MIDNANWVLLPLIPNALYILTIIIVLIGFILLARGSHATDPAYLEPMPWLLSGLPILLIASGTQAITDNIYENKLENAIITTADEKYGVTIHIDDVKTMGENLLDQTAVPVLVEYDKKLYDNTYILTYDNDEDDLILHYDHSIIDDHPAPAPEELHALKQSR